VGVQRFELADDAEVGPHIALRSQTVEAQYLRSDSQENTVPPLRTQWNIGNPKDPSALL
jgi:hypothetical protein